MSSITTDQGILHYEVYGRGRPVILLHGWLGSWGLWQETMTYLGQYYRTYALDFWGFGESGNKRSSYSVVDFVSLVNQFMDQMGIVCAPLVGHSMGGTVSLSVAIRYPERVQKVVIVGSPVVGSSLAMPLKMAGIPWIAFMLFNMFGVFRSAMRMASPHICRDPRFPDMMDHDLSRTNLESFLISIATLRKTDLRPEIGKIHVPTMGMFGNRDNIVNPRQWKDLKAGVPNARIERFPTAGHFIMLDEPTTFMEDLKDFLDGPELKSLMKKSSNRSCSQQIGQIIYEGIEEIIGKTESGLLFELAKFPLQHIKPQDAISNDNLAHKNLSRLLEVIEKTYGHKGGQGIAIRAGRASFKNVIRLYGQQMGFAKVDYRLMPTTARLKTGLHSLAKTLSDLWQDPITVLEDQSAWYWQMEHSPWCCERHSDESTCHFTVGLLEGYLAWASGEKYYPVVETMCAAAGHEYCAIQINKQAIE